MITSLDSLLRVESFVELMSMALARALRTLKASALSSGVSILDNSLLLDNALLVASSSISLGGGF
jgi:hypothetical protein